MINKDIDILGIGACGVDFVTKVASFSDKNNKVTLNNLIINGGGVTANNVIQSRKLGFKSMWCGYLGKDKEGDYLLEEFKRNKVKVKPIRKSLSQVCWIIINKSGEKQIYLFPNSTSLLSSKDIVIRFKKLIQRSKHFHTEIAVMPVRSAIKGCEIARQANCKIFLDIDGNIDYLINQAKIGSKKEIEKLIKMADVLKISESGLKYFSENKKIKDKIKALLKHSDIVAVTLGNKGCYIANSKEIIKCDAFKVKCLDSTGAGDGFMGGLSYAILKKWSLKETGIFANACGAYCCTKKGARNFGNIKQLNKLFKLSKLNKMTSSWD